MVAILLHTGWTEAELNRTKMGVVREVLRQMHVEARHATQGQQTATRGRRRR